MYHYIFNTLLRRSNEPCIQGDPCLYGLARTPAGCHAANGDLRIWYSVFFKLRIDAFYDLRKHLHGLFFEPLLYQPLLFCKILCLF